MTLNLKVRWTLEKSYRQYPFDSAMTAKQIIETVARKNKINNPQDYCIFVPPNTTGNGVWLDPNASMNSAGLKSGDTIELKLQPYPVYIVLAESTPKWLVDFAFREDKALAKLRVDFSDPLIELLPIVERILNEKLKTKEKDKEEYCFQYIYNNGSTQAVWLNVNISLEEQEVAQGAWFAVHPLSSQNKRSVESLKEHRMSGFLTKVSVKETKTTGSKKRWCVLKDNFLFYFKSQQEKTPNGVVAVEYYALVTDKTDGRFSLTPAPGCPFPRLTTTYEFSADSDNEYKEWVKALRERSATGAGKKVFGVPLGKVLRRKDRPSQIPTLMEKTMKYLEENGLDQEGLFRVSGGAAVIEKFKDEFDQSLDVDLSRCGDPHVVAGLLKLYLRELPEPLLTYDLYDKFVSTFQAVDRTQRLKALVDQIPPMNRNVLIPLLAFIRKVSEHSKTNLMGVPNLALVFAPNLLRPKVESAESLVQNAAAVNTLMEAIINEQDTLFGNANPGFTSASHVLSSSLSSPDLPVGITSGGRAISMGRGGAMNMSHIAAAAAAGGGASSLKRPSPKGIPKQPAQPLSLPDPGSAPTPPERQDIRPSVSERTDRPVASERPDRPTSGTLTASEKPPPTDSSAEIAVALYDYTAGTKGEISFTKGASMKVIKKHEGGWIKVEFNGTTGLAPSTYVRVEPAPQASPAPSSGGFTPALASGRGFMSQRGNPAPLVGTGRPQSERGGFQVSPRGAPSNSAPQASSTSTVASPTPASAPATSPSPSPSASPTSAPASPAPSSTSAPVSTSSPTSAIPSPSDDDLRGQLKALNQRLQKEVKARERLETLVESLMSKLEEETAARASIELQLIQLENSR